MVINTMGGVFSSIGQSLTDYFSKNSIFGTLIKQNSLTNYSTKTQEAGGTSDAITMAGAGASGSALKGAAIGLKIGSSLYSAYDGFKSASLNEMISKTQNNNLRLQADLIQLQVKQQLNNMNQELYDGISDIYYNSAVRGISSNNGNVQNNIQASSANSVKQQFSAERYGNLQANHLRLEADIQDQLAAAEGKNAKKNAITGAIGGIASAFSGKS
jgi:hypothetical protein